jgi:hypothetical protein
MTASVSSQQNTIQIVAQLTKLPFNLVFRKPSKNKEEEEEVKNSIIHSLKQPHIIITLFCFNNFLINRTTFEFVVVEKCCLFHKSISNQV